MMTTLPTTTPTMASEEEKDDDPTTDVIEDNGENPYLAMRAAKIARNKARLAALGLGKGKQQATPSAEIIAAREKRRLASLEPPQRRSLRIRYSVEPGEEGGAIAVSETTEEGERVAPLALFDTLPLLDTPIEKVSARDIQIDNDKIISNFLGVTFGTSGKAHCMQECAKLALPEPITSRISFNKYSGIQEWRNSVFLWVNLHVPGSQNKFLPENRITFYGGKSMVDESPIIQRLKAAVESSPGSMVILWCREYNPDKKNFYPYFCMGRLSLHSYDPDTQPIKFVWKLDDAEQLLSHSDPIVRNNMQELISVG